VCTSYCTLEYSSDVIRDGKRVKTVLDLQYQHDIAEVGLDSVKDYAKELSADLILHILKTGESMGLETTVLGRIQDAAEEFIDERPELKSKYLIEQWIKKVVGPMVRDSICFTCDISLIYAS